MNHSSDNFSWYDDRLLCLNTSNKGGIFDLDSEIDNAMLNNHASIEAGTNLLYPNPASDLVYISGKDGTLSTVLLYSLDGKLVLQVNNLSSLKSNINISHLPIGLYTYKIITNDGSTSFGKLNITR